MILHQVLPKLAAKMLIVIASTCSVKSKNLLGNIII